MELFLLGAVGVASFLLLTVVLGIVNAIVNNDTLEEVLKTFLNACFILVAFLGFAVVGHAIKGLI